MQNELPLAVAAHLNHALGGTFARLERVSGFATLFVGSEPARDILARWSRSAAHRQVLGDSAAREACRLWLRAYLRPSRAHLYAEVPYNQLLTALNISES